MIHAIDTQTTALAHPIPATLALRGDRARNPNHHLWNNNGTWWLHYTVHLADYTKRRVRESLRTGDLDEARRRRDDRLDALRPAR